jgi:DNA-binding CsgD family transcriptional regulator
VRGGDDREVNPYTELTEQEVLRLAAEGRSDAEIATALVISEKTVEAYVSNVLSKLDLADLMEAIAALLARAQAAGAVRPDVRLADLRTLLVATAHAAEFAADDAARSRVLGVIVDGLRSSSRAHPG